MLEKDQFHNMSSSNNLWKQETHVCIIKRFISCIPCKCGNICVGLISLLRLGSKTNTSTSASDNQQVGSSTVDLQKTVLLYDIKIHSTKPYYMDHTTQEVYETELHPKNRWRPRLEVTLHSLSKGMEEISPWRYKTLVSLIHPYPLLPLHHPVYPILAIYPGYCVPYLYLHTMHSRTGYMLFLPKNHDLQNAQKLTIQLALCYIYWHDNQMLLRLTLPRHYDYTTLYWPPLKKLGNHA